ncbi:MAG: sigma-70 family RNA polymerase sigma factor, partial [Zavarzinella sp.]|nr:sigma-70 family RNA polymerase sigma factor [Zavarzinella sp.]
MNGRLTAALRHLHPPDDGDLVTAFVVRRDPDAFAELVRRHGPMVLGVGRRVLGNVHDAEDAFQATFLVLARRAATVAPRAMVANWLYGVAYRTALEAQRMAARRRAAETRLKNQPRPPAEPAAHADLSAVLDQELSRLPDRLRLPVVLCDLDGRTRRDVARQLGVPDGTLSNRLAAGRRLLAKRLTRRGVTLPMAGLAVFLTRTGSPAAPADLVSSTVRTALGPAG